MKITLIIFLGFSLATVLGLLVATPTYFAGRFARRQLLDNKYYRERTSQLVVFCVSTPMVACTGLVVGATINMWYTSSIVFSFMWGTILGFASLENFADFASRLPKTPQSESY